MLADVFSEIMDGEPVVRHPLIWESSRFVVDEPTSAPDGRSPLPPNIVDELAFPNRPQIFRLTIS